MPQLRIHFTDADIAQTRLKLEFDFMWEVVSSVQILQHADGGLSFDPWRRLVRERVGRDNMLRPVVERLMAVAPHAAYFPDFLTPSPEVPDFGIGVDMVLSTSPRRLRAEIDRLQVPSGLPVAWLEDLGRGRPTALRQLGQALLQYFQALIEPHLRVVTNALRAECARGAQRYLQTGPEGLLRWLGPATRWEPPVLVVDGYPVDRNLHLDGRGLVLIPCYFCLYHPVALADPLLQPVLVFPIQTGSRLLAGRSDDGGSDPLSALLGNTRATILRAVVSSRTTTRLARLMGISPATVSYHAGVLRKAGLIMTERHENLAAHLITPLGLEVLMAAQ